MNQMMFCPLNFRQQLLRYNFQYKSRKKIINNL